MSSKLYPDLVPPRRGPARRLWAVVLVAVSTVIAGCATGPQPAVVGAVSGGGEPGDWHPMPFPGKPPTHYEWSEKEGRRAVLAVADRSAGMWRKRIDPAASRPREAAFSWWVQDAIPGADLTDADRGDAPARVMFGFDGDVAALPLSTRMFFDLVQTLTGEQPPYATLVYVWDARQPVGTVLVHPRSDRVRTIVVDSGAGELRRWRDHRRDLAADFRLAFGEDPGPLVSVAFMTDSDNTRSQAKTWYGSVELR
ncbi:DUF3047 domain-containing protein [Ideonella sp. DXS29W]|uniref:DUF3047 domain-containing protein n=1 Tax=Ideonella lacteola TaxID=2984193 RepID=A0ABU9BHS6_9BURK